MRGKLTIKGGNIVLPEGIARADVTIEGGNIVAVGGEGSAADGQLGQVIDAEGAWVLPGLIDVHCDAIEKEVEPRPNTLFPMDMAFLNFEKKLAGHGITTMLHSLS